MVPTVASQSRKSALTLAKTRTPPGWERDGDWTAGRDPWKRRISPFQRTFVESWRCQGCLTNGVQRRGEARAAGADESAATTC